MSKNVNENVNENVVAQVTELPFTAKVVTRFFDNKAGEKISYLSIEMNDPFDDELEPIALSFERNKGKDESGTNVPDKFGKQNKGCYMHYVKKALRVNPEFVLSGVITRRGFKDKSTKKVIDYVRIDLNNLDDNGRTRVHINNIESKAIFEKLATQRLTLLEDTEL